MYPVSYHLGKGKKMNQDKIEKGDTVHVHFTSSKSITYAKVLQCPQKVGQPWILKPDVGVNEFALVYVILFERMDLMLKGR